MLTKVMDMCWLDDQFIVSGSKDAKMALWRINEDKCDTDEENTESCPSYAHVSPLVVKECRSAQKVSEFKKNLRSSIFNLIFFR